MGESRTKPSKERPDLGKPVSLEPGFTGRKKGAGLRPESADEKADELSREEFEELSQWIEEGHYNSPKVAEEVAHRIVESGDLDR